MISKKELGYVSAWANKVPYPGNEYAEETMEKLKQAALLFTQIYENNNYNITFSNNEEIELEIKARNLTHMLGIDFKNLSKDLFRNFREQVLGMNPDEYFDSYTLLQRIIENSDKVINFDKTSDYLKVLNYYKLNVKCDIFSKLGNLADFNYGCINFSKEEFLANYNMGFYNPRSTKYLDIPSDEPVAPYFLMGILQDNTNIYDKGQSEENSPIDNEEDEFNVTNATYVVETSIAPDFVKPFFQNQEVVIPTQILKDSNKELTRITATPAQKKALLKEYRSIITTYNIANRINIYSDYLSMLSAEEEKSKKRKCL